MNGKAFLDSHHLLGLLQNPEILKLVSSSREFDEATAANRALLNYLRNNRMAGPLLEEDEWQKLVRFLDRTAGRINIEEDDDDGLCDLLSSMAGKYRPSRMSAGSGSQFFGDTRIGGDSYGAYHGGSHKTSINTGGGLYIGSAKTNGGDIKHTKVVKGPVHKGNVQNIDGNQFKGGTTSFTQS